MKILFVSPRYSGGVGGHANLLATKLRECGFEIDLLQVPHIPIKNLKNPSFVIFGILKVFFSNKKYDIVHAFNVPSAFIMKFVHAKKKVLSIHGVYSEQVEVLHSSGIGNVVKSNEQKVLRWADKITTDSLFVKNAYKEKLNLDFELLSAPIDANKFKTIPEYDKKQNQIVYVGRDSYEKGIDILRSIESKINGNVVYCTSIPWKEAMAIMKSSSVLVVPSRMESIPWVIKEAYYMKIPVLATNVGGISEILEDRVTGLLIEPNSPEKLLNGINLLLNDKTFATKLADNAYDYCMNNMTYDALLPKYVKFYEDLLKS